MAKTGGNQRGASLPQIQKVPGKPITEGALPPKIPVTPKPPTRPSGGGTGSSGGSKG